MATLLQTSIIKYNLKDRGRKYRGSPRNFNIAQVATAINSPETQERVTNRDMHGYYGHWPRETFGLIPREGALDSAGKLIMIEPAFVTTYLKAHSDGTIEHQAEFLDTESGAIAAKLYNSRAGGFSSAIVDSAKAIFAGFDYVLEPNFSTNRGYALDSAQSMTLDSIGAAIISERIDALNYLLDSVTRERDGLAEALNNAQAEKEELYSILAKNGGDISSVVLDSATGPVRINKDPVNRLIRDAVEFRGLAVTIPVLDASADAGANDGDYQAILSRFTR